MSQLLGTVSVGNVYVADLGNNRIRKVTVLTGTVSTVVGTGTASYSGDGAQATSTTLFNPSGVALDASGRIECYVISICLISYLVLLL